MANFSFVTDLNHILKMDDPMTKGPLPRWQRKVMDMSANSSMNGSKLSVSMTSINSSMQVKTPNKRRTPSKTPGSKRKSNPNTPKLRADGDRFIPTRSSTNFALGNYLINKSSKDDENNADPTTPHKENHILTETIHGGDPTNMRILSFKQKAPAPPVGHMNPLRVIYSQSKMPGSVKSSTRFIPQAPESVLDAPDIIDDYYLNLVDWSSHNVLAVSLANCVFLFNCETRAIQELVELEAGDYPCSVSWVGDGTLLAIGTFSGSIQIWDCSEMKRLRTMNGHSARVSSLSWNQYVLSSGSRSGSIIHHDVRQREHVIATLNGHSEEVCGLKWAPDGKYLASGGNDNLLNVWAASQGALTTESRPLYRLTAHQAAVKAIAWCPWHTSTLASGGGTADRCIRLWDMNMGTLLNSIDTKSQVSALVWAPNYKELVSGHGYANNQITIWNYPKMSPVAELTGHSQRVLHLNLSPDNSSVLSTAADETLRLWNSFAVDPSKKTAETKRKESSVLRLGLMR